MTAAMSKGQSELDGIYEIADDQLSMGSTLGSPKAVCIIKATGALKRVYNPDLGTIVFGALTLRHYDEVTGMHLPAQPGGKFVIHPERQERRFWLPNDIEVIENVFVVSGEPGPNGEVDPPGVYFDVTLRNAGSGTARISTYAYCELKGGTDHDIDADFDESLGALVVWNKSHPEVVRLFGGSEKPTSYETTKDQAKAVSGHSPGVLSGETHLDNAPLGALHHSRRIEAGQSARFNYLLSFGTGREQAIQNYKACPPAQAALERTQAHYHKILRRAVVITPNPAINRGVLWAKANMLRILIHAPTGWCFVNDPTQSNNSVARDTAWFAFGADYMIPTFAQDSLRAYVENQEPNGMAVEYYDIRNGTTADYKLNINDNTPLVILALWHHYCTSGDEAFLRDAYPAAAKSARHILSQRNEQGLVWCTSQGTSDWGIVGWRNVITGYRISGASTELNSECYAALRTVSKMARTLRKQGESAEFQEAAEALRDAINKHLLNPANGLYYLNIDVDGHARTDVTGDLVFPVMFGVASEETSARIVSRLSDDDFWTTGGIRTVPRDAPNYDPDGRNDGPYGLLGGVWVGVSFWYAFAAAPYEPEFMDHALAATFHNYSSDPRRNNTVPGQFSEWLNGETLVNEGMMLSPWLPPRYLWAAIEGMAGFDPTDDRVTLRPRLLPSWKWLGVRDLPYRGKSLTWLAARMPDLQIYANFEPEPTPPHSSSLPKPQGAEPSSPQVFAEDISNHVSALGDETTTIGFRNGGDLLLFVGSCSERTLETAVSVDLDLAGSYRLRVFRSLLGNWTDRGVVTAKQLHQGHVIEIERKGFCLLELHLEA